MNAKTEFVIFAMLVAFAATPAIAQVGVGVGLGGQTQLGVGLGAEVKAGGPVQADIQPPLVSTPDIAGRIEGNSQVAAQVESMLPAGSSIKNASAGFKNEGQFLSALHASHNLNIPFENLKTKMTGSSAMSLGSAIRASKPDMSENQAKDAAAKAEAQAKATASMKVAK